ncbi:MAG: type I-MYXAN CRISPR-associated protein Cas6/Cmx6 [Gammaproteobacteria bacterium]|nr:type I-MYXAN CRISPR-associated protein Cas6/Cmx6 [Gammaproteobacteria bacterium]
MYWEEADNKPKVPISDDVVDVVYKINCKTIPVDHAYSLYESVKSILPWIEEAGVGLHTIHVVTSGNGWMRPEDPDELLYLSKRTRFSIRVPNAHIADAKKLCGMELDIKGNKLLVDEMNIKYLEPVETLFCRYLVTGENNNDEEKFLASIFEQLKSLDIHARKMMCGKENNIKTPDGIIKTRSMMLADLDEEDSIKLQQVGLGSLQHMGCGLFIPHRGIKAVSSIAPNSDK